MTAEEPILVSDGPTDPEYESEEIIERDFTEDPEEEDEEEKRNREKDRKLREVVKLLDQLKVLLVKVLEE